MSDRRVEERQEEWSKLKKNILERERGGKRKRKRGKKEHETGGRRAF